MKAIRTVYIYIYIYYRDIRPRSPLPLYVLGLKPESRTKTVRERVNVRRGVRVSR